MLVFALAMREPPSHDEHQFVVGGWWIGVHGLLPYRDFPYHHLPNLLLLYALVGRLTPALLMNARVLSALLGVGTLILLLLFARRRPDATGWFGRWLIGASAALMLVLSPLFAFTSGRAWNHALPTFLTVAAFMIHLSAGECERATLFWGVSGALLGFAVGARVSYLPAIIVFLGYLLLRPFPRNKSSRRRSVAAHLLGFGLSLLPTFLLAALAPTQFAYGSVIYPRLNTSYRQALWHSTGMNLPEKLGFIGERVILDPPHAFLLALYIASVLIVAVQSRHRGWEQQSEFWFATGTAALLWIGSIAPTPSWYQYFYAPLPFLILGMVSMVAGLLREAKRKRPILLAVGLAALAMTILRWEAIEGLQILGQPSEWVPIKVHELGKETAASVDSGRILTLAPIFPAEGGLEPYPKLTTGSFDWRVSPILSAERRATYGVVSPAELAEMIADDPPAGVLVGFEINNEGFSYKQIGGLEQPLDAYARESGFLPLAIQTSLSVPKLTLWVQPGAE